MKDLQAEIKERATQHSFAVIDFDNTCIVNDIAEATLAYLCKNELLKNKSLLEDNSEDTYHKRVFQKYYALLNEKGINDAYLFCAKVIAGFSEKEIEKLVSDVIDTEGEVFSTTELYGVTIAKGLATRSVVMELLRFLQDNNIDIWIVSASPECLARSAVKHFGIPGKTIGLRNLISEGVLQEKINEPYSIAEGKVACIKKYISKTEKPLMGIGDSMNDFPMIEYADIHAIIDKKNALSKEAISRGWHIL